MYTKFCRTCSYKHVLLCRANPGTRVSVGDTHTHKLSLVELCCSSVAALLQLCCSCCMPTVRVGESVVYEAISY